MNFDSDSCRTGQPEQGTISHFTEDVKCFKCGKIGHRQSDCRAKVSVIVCYECGEKDHKANECSKTKNKSKTGAPRETTQNKRFSTKQNESNLAAEKQGFSFYTSQVNSTCKNIDLLIDNGSTSHMIKDAELFRDFAYRAAFHLKNRCLHSAHSMTPFEKFFDKTPHLSHFRVFGCQAFMYLEEPKRKKLESRALEGFFTRL